MSDIQELQNAIIAFRDERDWKQFHSKKDLILGLIIEASELAEHAIWDRANETYEADHRENIEDEFADIMHLLLLIGDAYNIDITLACKTKLAKTRLKYPIEKSKGRATKHTEL